MTDYKTSRIAFVKANWHADIVDNAYDGFMAEAANVLPGATVDVYNVPGAFEMPLMAKRLAKTGQYDAVVAAAIVVNGGIYHHEFVSDAVVKGLMDVQLETDVPCFSVSLTPHNYQETDLLTAFFANHFVTKGAEAARAVRGVFDIELPKPALSVVVNG